MASTHHHDETSQQSQQHSTFSFRMKANILLLLLFFTSFSSVLSKFDPYQINGGLVTAIAGPTYVIFATDTRLTDGGYEIKSRSYTSSRLWNALGESTDDALLTDVTSQGTFVASAGCAADCEALKRIVQTELSARSFLGVSNAATLLGQVLYSKRSFPFYSFCVLGGLKGKRGAVYVYDAIGSFEQVAVGCAGTGREMMQPVLDRFFSSSCRRDGTAECRRDGKAVLAEHQQVGSVTLQPPVQTYVDCEVEEAVGMVVKAYQAVCEREIGVGDEVCVCVVKSSSEGKGGRMQVLRFPLKQH